MALAPVDYIIKGEERQLLLCTLKNKMQRVIVLPAFMLVTNSIMRIYVMYHMGGTGSA